MKKLLDVGCGPGTLSNLTIYHSLKDKYEIYGIDREKKSVVTIQKNYPSGVFAIGDAEKIPFNNNYFDLVICRHVLEHVQNTSKTLIEIKRVLKKNGRIILAVPDYRFEQIMVRLQKDYIGHKSSHHQRTYTVESFSHEITSNGFKIVQSTRKSWPMFVLIVILTLLATFTKKIDMEKQSGVFKIGKDDYLGEKKISFVMPLYRVLEWVDRMIPFMNKIIPWEIEIRAKK